MQKPKGKASSTFTLFAFLSAVTHIAFNTSSTSAKLRSDDDEAKLILSHKQVAIGQVLRHACWAARWGNGSTHCCTPLASSTVVELFLDLFVWLPDFEGIAIVAP